MGDFNSRTGKYSNTVSQPAQRNTFDNVLNSHGEKTIRNLQKP